MLANRGYDSNRFRDGLAKLGITACMHKLEVIAPIRQMLLQLTPVTRARNPPNHASTPHFCMLSAAAATEHSAVANVWTFPDRYRHDPGAAEIVLNRVRQLLHDHVANAAAGCW